MIERELTHRLWVSSRFSWLLKLSLLAVYASWAAWAVYWIEGPKNPPEWMSYSWIYVLISFFWAWPFVPRLLLLHRCSAVWWEGGVLMTRRLGEGKEIYEVNEDTKISRIAKYKGWHEPGDVDDLAKGGVTGRGLGPGGLLILVYGLFCIVAMLLPRWQRDFFELRTSKFSRGGKKVYFYHPRRRLGSGQLFQPGMQLLLKELTASAD